MTSAIETVGAGDIDAIAALHAASFDDAWGAPMIQRVLAMPGAFGLVARADDGTLAGFALGRTVVDECELLSLAVAPARRGHGIGARLLDAAMAAAAATGGATMFLEVAETNDVAIALYRGRGFVVVGRRPGYYELRDGGTLAALTMRVALAGPARPRPS